MFDVDALLFDLDGTLVDTRAANYAAYATALAEVGIAVDQARFNAMADGRNWRWFLPRIMGPDAAKAPSIAARKAELYPRFVREARPNTELVGLARAARGHVATFLVTTASSANAGAVLRRCGLCELFDLIVSGDDVTRYKPDPQAYALATMRLGVEPGRCLAFEDSDAGAASARAAGVPVIRVSLGVDTQTSCEIPDFLKTPSSPSDRTPLSTIRANHAPQRPEGRTALPTTDPGSI